MPEREPQPIDEGQFSPSEMQKTIEELEAEAARHKVSHDTRRQAEVEREIYQIKRQREMQDQVH